MLRELIKYEVLWQALSEDGLIWELFSTFPQNPNFDLSIDAFNSLRDFLLRHKQAVSAFLLDNYDAFVDCFQRLLESDNYVIQRQSVRLLGEVLLDRSNYEVMIRFINSQQNLQKVMTLLLSPSPAIQFEAFQLFKVFVVNPNKAQPISMVLYWNGNKLKEFLSKFLLLLCLVIVYGDICSYVSVLRFGLQLPGREGRRRCHVQGREGGRATSCRKFVFSLLSFFSICWSA